MTFNMTTPYKILCQNGKMGASKQNDLTQNIAPIYDEVKIFSYTIVWAKHDGKWGQVSGISTPALIYDEIAPVYSVSGLLAVQKGNKAGFVNMHGEEVVPCIFDYVWPFEKDNSRAIAILDGKLVVIDSEGKLHSELSHVPCFFFWECEPGIGLFLACRQWSVTDRLGNVLDAPYGGVVDGPLLLIGGPSGNYLVSDTRIMSPLCKEIDNCHGGFCAFVELTPGDERRWSGHKGYLNCNAEVAIPAVYDEVGEFNDGRAPVEKDGERYFINENGERLNDGIPSEDEFIDWDDHCWKEFYRYPGCDDCPYAMPVSPKPANHQIDWVWNAFDGIYEKLTSDSVEYYGINGEPLDIAEHIDPQNIDLYKGKKVLSAICRVYEEDFVDEELGEICKVDRYDLILSYGDIIDEDAIRLIKESERLTAIMIEK